MTTKIKTFGGNIGIGTTDPGDFKLNVNGSLKTDSLVVNGITNAQVPIGLIQLWYGTIASIPSGWVLCDGNSHNRSDGGGPIATPDLRSRFIMGGTSISQVDDGGANNVTLSEAKLAPHSHGVTIDAKQVPHSHGGDSNQTQTSHNHLLNDNEVPHNHNALTKDVPHNHSMAGLASHVHNDSGGGTSTHSHGDLTNNTNTHSHGIGDTDFGPGPAAFRGFPGQPNTSSQIWTNNNKVSGNADVGNMPHGHQLLNNATAHTHGSNASNTNHRHAVDAQNTPHSHQATTVAQAKHSHGLAQGGTQHVHEVNASEMEHPHTGSSNNAGQGTPFSVLNSYYALAYIMKI